MEGDFTVTKNFGLWGNTAGLSLQACNESSPAEVMV